VDDIVGNSSASSGRWQRAARSAGFTSVATTRISLVAVGVRVCNDCLVVHHGWLLATSCSSWDVDSTTLSTVW